MAEKLKIAALGGLNEIGKNMTVFEYANDMIVVDCGTSFPDEEMLGVDLVIPDIKYLEKNADKIRGIFLTHGHEDHIGALPYVLRSINAPVYATRLTMGIVETKLIEHRMLDKSKLNVVGAGDIVEAGCFNVELIRTNHSMPDSVAFAINTPLGAVIVTGDFKIDPTPVAGKMMDLTRLGEYGENGVLLLMSDSTNVERPGYAMSESKVGESFDYWFKGCEKRIIIASFASNVHRIQQIINCAEKYGRKVAVSGRSMDTIIGVAMNLGYLNVPENIFVDIASVNKYPKHKITIITTGSQGESMSALYRMAFSGHKQVEIGSGDRVIIAASPIPGNEKSVYRVINELFRKGAEVVYERMAEVHVSGHACQEELKIVLALTNPEYFMPVHGEYRHLKAHATIAQNMGIEPKNIFISEIGRVLEISSTTAKFNGTVPSGKILVDGLSVGDVGSVVLRDRKHLAQDGLIVIVVTLSGSDGMITAGPDIVSRGFVYVKESDELMEEMRQIACRTMDKCMTEDIKDWSTIKSMLKNDMSHFLYQKTKRSPMILPVIMEN